MDGLAGDVTTGRTAKISHSIRNLLRLAATVYQIGPRGMVLRSTTGIPDRINQTRRDTIDGYALR